jgi:hypothetical protein
VAAGRRQQCCWKRRSHYLGLHLDRRLSWHRHIFAKRDKLGITLTKIYWLLGRKSKLSANNKLILYKAIPKPMSTYGIQLWGTASTSNIEILECFQSKALRVIADAPWYVPNAVIRRDLQTPTAKEQSAATAINTELASVHTQTTQQ